MKIKIALLMLPLLCAAGVAMGQDTAPGAAASDAAQVPARNQVRPRTDVRNHHRHMGKPRQGRDMRRCLKLKTNAAIIRCAEPGRKP